jgi:hypothetical protein
MGKEQRLMFAALAFRAITIWRSLRYFAAIALRWAFGSPARIFALLAVAALALAAWQYRVAENTRADLAQARSDHAADLARANAARLAAEAKSRKDAQDAQARYLALSADADARDAAYAAAHRLPASAGHTAQPAKAESASLPAIPTSAAVLAALDRVWITRADWRACDADYSYALAAHQWAGAIAP